MPEDISLQNVPTHALVEELSKRFKEIAEARKTATVESTTKKQLAEYGY